MSGLEVLGAVAASLEVVSVIRKSVKFFNDVRKAEAHKAEQSDLHLSLFVQAEKFQAWCNALEIPELLKLMSEKRSGTDQKFTHLQKKFELELRLANTGLAQLILGSVQRLTEKLKEASDILQNHESPSTPEGNAVVPPTSSKPKRRWYNKLSVDKGMRQATSSGPNLLVPTDAPRLGHLAAASKSAQWVGQHRSAFQKLLKEIERTNEDLHALLERSQRDRANRNAENAILSRTHFNNLSTLPENNGIKVLVRMKTFQDGQAKDTPINIQDTPRAQLRVYRVEEFHGVLNQIDLTHSICQLEAEQILVEWKFYSQQKPIRMQRMAQLSNLVNLLQEKDLYLKFLSPACKGLVSDDVNSRIGIIFAITSHPRTGVHIEPKFSNLQTLIRDSSASSSAMPSLGTRFVMAKKVALAIYNLHSVHWLHKSFRSDNIVFFEDTRGKDVPLRPQQNGSLNDPSGRISLKPSTVSHQLPPFYLIGWNMSRPDSPYEYTESVSHTAGDFKGRRENMKLYSHPDVHSNSQPRVRYQAKFDIYSLGLVLLEIGLWRTLDMIRKRCSNDDEFRDKIKTEWCDKLSSRMGAVYWQATQRCLAGDFEQSLSNAPDDDFSTQNAFHEQVVCELEKCCA